MENSNIWIALVFLGVFAAFFAFAYYSLGKPKIQRIEIRVPQSVPVPRPTYVVDASYHSIVPAPQWETTTIPVTNPLEPFYPAALPTTLVDQTMSYSLPTTLVDQTMLPYALPTTLVDQTMLPYALPTTPVEDLMPSALPTTPVLIAINEETKESSKENE